MAFSRSHIVAATVLSGWFFASLGHELRAQSSWYGDYHGASDVTDHSTGLTGENRNSRLQISALSPGSPNVRIDLFVNGIAYQCWEVPSTVTSSRLVSSEQLGSYRVTFDLARSGDIVTGTMTQDTQRTDGTYALSISASLNVVLPPTNPLPDPGIVNAWVGRLDGAADLSFPETGSTNLNQTSTVIIEQDVSSGTVMVNFYSTAPTLQAWAVPQVATSNQLRVVEYLGFQRVTAELWRVGAGVTMDISEERRRTNGTYVTVASHTFATAGVSVELANKPTQFALLGNYPNPLGNRTTIVYELAAPTDISLTLYNAVGKRIDYISRGRQGVGRHDLVYDTSGLAPGVYFYRLAAGDYVETKRMVVVK